MKSRLILAILYMSVTIVTIKHKLKMHKADPAPAEPVPRVAGPLGPDAAESGKKLAPVTPDAVVTKGK